MEDDNVVFLDMPGAPDTIDDLAPVKKLIGNHLADISTAVDAGEIRGVVIVAIRMDGGCEWSLSGDLNKFEIIAALETTKHGFLNTLE